MKIKPNTLKKYRALHERYNHLYKVERIRYDDVERQLSEEFFYSVGRVQQILRMDLTPKPQPTDG